MAAPATLAAFALSTLVLLLVPGPSVLFVVVRTVEHGRTAGLISMLGLETGGAHPRRRGRCRAVRARRLRARRAGGAALCRRRLPALAGRPGAAPSRRGGGVGGRVATARAAVPPRRARRPAQPEDGAFLLAFLPGFVHVGHEPVALQVAVLGMCFVALATLTDGAYTLTAARLSRNAPGGRGLARASAGAYCVLGALALAGGA